MVKMAQGKVYLVGAGPGDPGLITVKGKECLEKSDVVIYDRLVGERLLSNAREGAELIYVGKQPDQHTLTQEEINNLLIQKAREGKVVTRLKGGDPYVFGRGGEEAEALADHGIPFEVVPGITSAVAVPAYAGIPLTHRSFTSTVAFVAGHKKGRAIDLDAVSKAGTIVLLMAMENLENLTRGLIERGRPADTPVAVIRWGTRVDQKTVIGTISNITELVREARLGSPAVVVVGEVVSLRDKLKWFEGKPLFGKRVLVTRTREQAGELSRRIEELGGEAIEFPVIKIVPADDLSSLEQALKEITTYRWLILTSANGVDIFFRFMQERGMDARYLGNTKVAAIGPQTAVTLRRWGILADYVPREYRAEAIIEGMQDKINPGDRILLARAGGARDILPRGLAGLGAQVNEVVTYRSVPDQGDRQKLVQMLDSGRIDFVTFTSSSTVTNLMAVLGDVAVSLLRKTRVACIGPITADTARSLGLQVDVIAGQYTIPGLVEAMAQFGEGK